jgi:putative transposase
VDDEWRGVGEKRKQVELDAYQIMPNHFHGIVWLLNEPDLDVIRTEQSPVRARQASPLPVNPRETKSGSLGAVIGGFKSGSTRRAKKYRWITGGSIWQRNYWERIIRNERELEAIRNYIWNNPVNWNMDQLHPQNPESARWLLKTTKSG